MEPWQQRVIEEKDALQIKFDALTEFLRGEAFKGVADKEQHLLKQQHRAMSEYLYILYERIASW